MGKLIRLWLKRIAAALRLSPALVCEMSQGARDYHDYPDSITPSPWHFHTHICARCGKAFRI